MESLLRRSAITLAAVAAYRFGLQVITVPGLDERVLAEFFGGGASRMPHGGGVHIVGPLTTAAPGVMAVGTYVSASILVLLASGFVPFLKRLREGCAAERIRFDFIIIATTAALAAVQGWGTAQFLESIRGPSSGVPLVADPGWGFRLTTVLTLAAAALLVVWLVHVISARGLGNGVAVLLVAEILAEGWVAAPAQWRSWAGAVDPVHQVLRAAVLVLPLLLLAVVLVRARREVPLECAGDGDSSGVETPKPLPLRVNPVGALPLLVAEAWLYTVVAQGGSSVPASPPALTDFVGRGLAFAMFVALLSYACVAITFDPRDAVGRAAGYGLRLVDAAEPGDAARQLRRTLYRAMIPGVLGLWILGMAPWIAQHGLGLTIGFSHLCGPPLLVLAAVALDLAAQSRHRRDLGRGDWVVALHTETRFELELAADVLRREGITSVPQANLVIPATGTMAFWEICRPALPSLTVHRRLGGGVAALLVPVESAAAAKRALVELGVVRDA